MPFYLVIPRAGKDGVMAVGVMTRADEMSRGWNRLALMAVLLVGTWLLGGEGWAEWKPKSHDEWFTEKNKSAHLVDPYVWAYTSAFAKRFGMPKHWIYDDLKGAEALAYRVKWTSTESCGYFRDPKNCRPETRCLLEAFIPKSAPLPWKTDRDVDASWTSIKSAYTFLKPQKKEDRVTWDPIEKKQTHEKF